MSSGSPPPAPDYEGAAERTSEGDLTNARVATQANRPDEYTPYGSRTWEQGFDQEGFDSAQADWDAHQSRYDTDDQYRQIVDTTTSLSPDAFGAAPDRNDFNTDQWTSHINMTPEGQELFDQDQASRLAMGEMGMMGLDQMKDLFSSKFSIDGQTPEYTGVDGSVPDYQGGNYDQTRGDVVDAMMSRVNTDIGRDRQSKEAQLIAAGIPKGSEAFDREMESLDRKQTDARQQANIAATSQAAQEHGLRQGDAQAQFVNDMQSRGMSRQEAEQLYQNQMSSRQQGISEALVERNQPLNEYSAFNSGSQVNMPQFQAYGQQATTGGPDYMGATAAAGDHAMAGYNADQARTNSYISGLMGLGGAAIMAPKGTFSDVRLKHNINRVGSFDSGIPAYVFSYIGSDERYYGVMAQEVMEVMPNAVILDVSGYYKVDYGMLN